MQADNLAQSIAGAHAAALQQHLRVLEMTLNARIAASGPAAALPPMQAGFNREQILTHASGRISQRSWSRVTGRIWRGALRARGLPRQSARGREPTNWPGRKRRRSALRPRQSVPRPRRASRAI